MTKSYRNEVPVLTEKDLLQGQSMSASLTPALSFQMLWFGWGLFGAGDHFVFVLCQPQWELDAGWDPAVAVLLVTFWGHWAGSSPAGATAGCEKCCLLACLLMSLLLLSLPGLHVKSVKSAWSHFSRCPLRV